MRVGIGIKGGSANGLRCANCRHALSNHNLYTTRRSTKVTGKCRFCKCKKLSIE